MADCAQDYKAGRPAPASGKMLDGHVDTWDFPRLMARCREYPATRRRASRRRSMPGDFRLPAAPGPVDGLQTRSPESGPDRQRPRSVALFLVTNLSWKDAGILGNTGAHHAENTAEKAHELERPKLFQHRIF